MAINIRYALIKDGQVARWPETATSIARRHPKVDPTEWASLGYVEVIQPDHDPDTHRFRDSNPVPRGRAWSLEVEALPQAAILDRASRQAVAQKELSDREVIASFLASDTPSQDQVISVLKALCRR